MPAPDGRGGRAGVTLALLAAGCGGTVGGGADGVAAAGGAKAPKRTTPRPRRTPSRPGSTSPGACASTASTCPTPSSAGDGFVRSAQGRRRLAARPRPGSGSAAAGDGVRGGRRRRAADFLDDVVRTEASRSTPRRRTGCSKFAQCMREHGVDMPDPEFSGGGGTVPGARSAARRHRPRLAHVQERPGGVRVAVRPDGGPAAAAHRLGARRGRGVVGSRGCVVTRMLRDVPAELDGQLPRSRRGPRSAGGEPDRWCSAWPLRRWRPWRVGAVVRRPGAVRRRPAGDAEPGRASSATVARQDLVVAGPRSTARWAMPAS